MMPRSGGGCRWAVDGKRDAAGNRPAEQQLGLSLSFFVLSIHQKAWENPTPRLAAHHAKRSRALRSPSVVLM
jgi:hypothetical protein